MSALDARLSRRSFLGSALIGLAGLSGLGLGDRAFGGARWRRLSRSASNPPVRHDHSLTLATDSGLLYLFGGRRGGSALNDLWALDPRTGAWRKIAVSGTRPAARFGHNAFYDAVRRRLIVALGQAGSSFFNDVWAFDPRSSAWRKLGTASARRPAPRYGAGGAHDRAGSRILISHGFTSQGRFDDTWSFDLRSESWRKIATRGPVPLARCLLRAAWDPGSKRMLLFGGQSNPIPFLGDFWSLDVAGGVWKRKRPATLPGPRNLYGASFDESARRWYLFGGSTPKGPAADTWTYDARRDAWSRVAASPGPRSRSGPDIAVAGGNLYLFGGAGADGELADTWVLELA